MSHPNFPFGTGPDDYERSAGFISDPDPDEVFEATYREDEIEDEE